MIIGQIKDGIVLDHITAGRSMEIYNILKLDRLEISEMNGLFEIKPVYGAYDAALLIRGGTA